MPVWINAFIMPSLTWLLFILYIFRPAELIGAMSFSLKHCLTEPFSGTPNYYYQIKILIYKMRTYSIDPWPSDIKQNQNTKRKRIPLIYSCKFVVNLWCSCPHMQNKQTTLKDPLLLSHNKFIN